MLIKTCVSGPGSSKWEVRSSIDKVHAWTCAQKIKYTVISPLRYEVIKPQPPPRYTATAPGYVLLPQVRLFRRENRKKNACSRRRWLSQSHMICMAKGWHEWATSDTKENCPLSSSVEVCIYQYACASYHVKFTRHTLHMKISLPPSSTFSLRLHYIHIRHTYKQQHNTAALLTQSHFYTLLCIISIFTA